MLVKREPQNSEKKLIGVGELLKKTWRIYKENFWTLIKVAFIPSFLLFLIDFWRIKTSYPFSFNLKYIIFHLFIPFLLSCWLTASLIFVIKDRGKRIDFKKGLKLGAKKIISLFWIYSLFFIIISAGIIFLIIPGIILWVWFCLASYVLIYEDKRGMDALLRSKDLVSGNWWSVFWRIIIISVIYFFIFFIHFLGSNFFITESFFNFISLFFSAFILFIFTLFFFPFYTIYFALIYENLSLIKKIELEITLKRKLKYLLPTILATIIIGIIGGAIFGVLYFGYKRMLKEPGGKEIMDLIKVMFKLEMYYKDHGKYPSVFGSNQWDILKKELKMDLPKGNYEYWVSKDNQNYILKATLKSWSDFLKNDIDGEPFGPGLVNCGVQGENEREFCISSKEFKKNQNLEIR